MSIVLAALPLVCVLAGMALLHASAITSGLAGLFVAMMLALGLVGPFGLANAVDLPFVSALTGTLAEALHLSLRILWIVLPALALHAFQSQVGAIERIRDALTGLTENRRIQGLLIAWFFGLFVEGAAGFGTPVALAAPLLYGIGYPPVRAVVLALVGHASAVSFGAVGTPTLAQVAISGFDGAQLAGQVAWLHVVLGWILLFATVKLADDTALSRSDMRWAVLAGTCFFVPFIILATFAGPELPSLAGALLGAAVFVAIIMRTGGSRTINTRALLVDVAPYLMIVLLVLATRLIGPLQAMTGGWVLEWQLYDRFSGNFAPFYHPGTLLWAGLLLGAFITGRSAAIGVATVEALNRVIKVAIALFIMLALSRVMVQSGMITSLADAAASTGLLWPLFAPSVGVMGTFITGSATTSNILFTELQLSAAEALNLPPLTMAAAQGFGSAVGNLIAPHNIIAGAATVGLVGREGEILSRTILLCLVYTLLGGLCVLAAITFIN